MQDFTNGPSRADSTLHGDAMKRADGKVATEKLPSFFSKTAAAPAYDDTEYVDEVVEEEFDEVDEIVDEVTDDDEAAEFAADPDAEDGELADEGYADEDLGDEQDDDDPAPSRRPGRQRRERTTRAAEAGPSGGGGGAFALGILAMLGGVGIGLAGEAGARLGSFGLAPNTLLVLGAVAIAAGCVRRWLNEVAARSAGSASGADSDAIEQLGAQLAELLEHKNAAPENLGDAQHVLLALQKQDEKTNNLTKAIKMYGKPLMDIANHGTELAATLAQVKTTVEAGGDTARAAYSRLESQIRKSGGDAVQEQMGKFEIAIHALSQRLDDSSKTLVRLEDATAKSREQIEQLSRGESVEAAAKSLHDQLEAATRKLQGGMAELRDGNLGELETTVRDIQREVATVATAVSQIQAAIKSGAMSRPAPAAAPAAAAPSPAPTPAPAPA
ncbi:MAG: hypothetical protein KDE27_22055, partial [Planctomycetes bacterium]|nr:hypothetical protein [Planctomycetota bacterium]